jgi:hypothetical protein
MPHSGPSRVPVFGDERPIGHAVTVCHSGIDLINLRCPECDALWRCPRFALFCMTAL